MGASSSEIGGGAGQFTTVSVSNLRPGARLGAPIYDAEHENDVLLLARGSTITESILNRLQKRGIRLVRVRSSELSRITLDRGRKAGSSPPVRRQPRRVPTAASARTEPAAPPESATAHWGVSSQSFVHTLQKHEPRAYDSSRADTFKRDYSRSVDQVGTLFEALKQNELANGRKLADLSQEALTKITEDIDLFVSLGLQPVAERYPFKHSLQTAMLGTSVGTILGLSRQELLELGIGCMVHDVGMLHISQSLVNSRKSLDPIDFLEITKHPTVTFDLLRSVPDLPVGARLVAYQMHERCNGSGYPRQRPGKRIHPLAKVAAVTDVFVALLSPRPYRAARLPYQAMEQLVYGAREGLFDPEVVRALLKTVSLFPIGSWVETSDGRMGRVIRANHDAYTRPVVELWSPHDGGDTSEIVDLAQSDLAVTRPLPAPGNSEEEANDARPLIANWE